MRMGNIVSSVMKLWLGIFCVALLLAGCGSGGGDGKPKGSTTALKGTVQIPDGINAPASSLSKASTLAKSIPFTGAAVVAISMEDGTEYPQKDAAVVSEAGSFSITGVPLGQKYLIRARKGNLVMLKFYFVPADGPATTEVGIIDSATTAGVLLVEQQIRNSFPGVEINLADGMPDNVSTGAVDEALAIVDPVNQEGHLRDLVDEANEIDASNSPPTDKRIDVITNQNGVVDLDSVAILNFNLILIKIIKAADINASTGGAGYILRLEKGWHYWSGYKDKCPQYICGSG
jgi:hypothetical protein